MPKKRYYTREAKPLPYIIMLLLALLVGVLAGLGAIVFDLLFSLIRNLTFLGKFSFHLDMSNYLAPSPWGIGVVFVPFIGSIVVTWVINNFGDEVRGSGVPDVIHAIYYRKGLIAPVVAAGRALATAVSAGTGASVGRDGPMVQIGSALGSTVGQIVRMPPRQRNLLVTAGAGAGIAAIFNMPIGALTFVVEVLMISVNARNFGIVAIATVSGSYVGRLYLGASPIFHVSPFDVFKFQYITWYELLAFVPFGIVIGIVSALFIRSVFGLSDFLAKYSKNYYLKHGVATLLVGFMLYAFMYYTGRYYVEGVSYAPINDILNDILNNPWLLIILFFAKFAATTLTLGTGASGGVFSPSLFLGATMGSVFGICLSTLYPGHFDPSIFAVAGMAGCIGSVIGAALTGIVMVFEQTRDYHAILPIALTVGIANFTRYYFIPQTAYTLKEARKGFVVPTSLIAGIMTEERALDAMTKAFEIIPEDKLNDYKPRLGMRYVLVERDSEIVGFLRNDSFRFGEDIDFKKHYSKRIAWANEKTLWPATLRLMRKNGAKLALVTKLSTNQNIENIVGVVGWQEVAEIEQMMASLL